MTLVVPDFANEVMPSGAQTMFTVVTGVPLVVVAGIAVALIVRDGDPVLGFAMIGGLFASFFEPVADILACLYFPGLGQHTAFTTFGRPIPWALVFAYPWYVGGQGYVTYRLLERGAGARRIWLLWGLFALSDVAVETPGVQSDFHTYYGHQPLNPWGFPLWMAAVQSLMPMIAGALILAVRPHVRRTWQLAVVIPLIPMADGMANAGLALPVYSTLGSDLSVAANTVAALATIGMAALTVWLLTRLAARSPAAHPGVVSLESSLA